MSDDLLIKGKFEIEKFEGKGGWHYVKLPIKTNPNNPFGWQQVKGKINNYNFSQYKLMPMGNGNLFLPIKKEIRKTEKLTQGDKIEIEIYIDNSKHIIPIEIEETLKMENEFVYQKFLKLSPSHQKEYINWIMEAKKNETKEARLLKLINELNK